MQRCVVVPRCGIRNLVVVGTCWYTPKFNIAPENGGWKTTFLLSYWEGNFSGAMLNFGGVAPLLRILNEIKIPLLNSYFPSTKNFVRFIQLGNMYHLES